MKVIDLLNKIANGEINRNNEYQFSRVDYCTINDFFARYIVDEENLNLEIIEEDKFKTKVMVVDKEGNEKEYLLELDEGLKEGEKIFKANDGHWYVQKLIDEKSEFYKWLDEFEPTIYYSMEEEKKIPERLPKSVTNNACSSKDERLIANTINEIIDYLDYLKSKGE